MFIQGHYIANCFRQLLLLYAHVATGLTAAACCEIVTRRHTHAGVQDLAVVVLLMLIPLLAPSDSGALGLSKIAKALGLAALKAVVAIVTIIAGGRTLLRPLYRRIAAMENNEIFAALTLLVVLGTSVMTQIAGLSLALGAFLVWPC